MSSQDKTSEKVLNEFNLSEMRFRNALDDLMEGFMIIGFDWTYLYVNKAAAHQAFQEPENLIGRKYMEMYPGIENTEIFAMYLRCMGERISLKFESSYTFENGIVKWFELNLEPVSEGMIVLSLDITERRVAEDELRIKEERYRLLAENARDVIWTMKLDGTITYISPAVELLSGFTVEEAMHMPLDKIMTPESQVIVINYIHRLNSAFEAGLPLPSNRAENEYYCKNGSTLWTEVIVYPMQGIDNHSLMLLGVTRDISERKKFEAQLLDQTDKLKKINASKDKFFSIIAHDLKSPFNGILGFSEILKDEARDLDIDTIISYAEIINSTAKQTFRLLENLLEWAVIQQKGIVFEPKRIFINSLIENEIKGLQHNAHKKSIALVNDTLEEIIITADGKMISLIIRNLISNAIKFTHKEGTINVKARMKTDCVEVSISDNGVGMAKERLEKLFNIETSFTSHGTENEKGTGLGLLLCKDFVEKHGGKIRAVSKLGKGSQFIFTIPLGI